MLLTRSPNIRALSQIYTASIRAAEATGKLDMVLDRFSEALERDGDSGGNQATRYPITVSPNRRGLCRADHLVQPRFAEFYASYDTPLPKPTQIIIALGVFFQKFMVYRLPLNGGDSCFYLH